MTSRVNGVVALELCGIPVRNSVSTRAILISQLLIPLSWRCRERAARLQMAKVSACIREITAPGCFGW